MQKQKTDFANVRRLAPGPFAAQMLDLLAKEPPARVDIINIEVGENPFLEQLEVTFRVRPHTKYSGGTKLFFTFSAGASAEENLKEFNEFVKVHAEKAGTAPEGSRGAHHFGSAGD